ncbi:MAG TPA: biotin--[acetyl-CoA-carboxylase] ligase [Dehalococcoidia bacterium]|jgi:BirA family biotin operon repressor/biotin-[acetyl-CoA-carboxylase] ligase|nr:biotin--[acetyl-CoA-carboxylase] ligase [Dehalococcoidia bacterium]
MPRNLVAETLRQGLYTRLVSKRILFFQTLDSTMDEAARQAEAGVAEGTVVVAETQSLSRGRMGRTWVSQPGNLYVSVLFYPALEKLPHLSSLSAVAVVRAIRKTCRLAARLKWPNDVLVKGKKVAGVLVESAVDGESVRYAIVGIGINVTMECEKVDELSGYATSLEAAAQREMSRERLLRDLLQEIDGLYLKLAEGQTPLEEWKTLLDTLGQQVTVSFHGESHTGLAEDVDEVGNLLLRVDDGELITLTAGDVTLQHPVSNTSCC